MYVKQKEPSNHLGFALKTLAREPPLRKEFKNGSRHSPGTSIFYSMMNLKTTVTRRMRSSKMSKNSTSVSTPQVTDTYMHYIVSRALHILVREHVLSG
jgi:hypothetical protein